MGLFKKHRTKHGITFTLLGAFSLFMAVLILAFYMTDSFTMYWFLLQNQDGVTQRRRKADTEWYDASSGGLSISSNNGNRQPGNGSLYYNNAGQAIYTIRGDSLSLDVLLEQFELSEIASGDFFARFLIFKMDQAGYVPNAVIGTVAYMLCEAGGMGSFTYENYYIGNNGPEGKYSKTLDNQAWLDWMQGPGKIEAKRIYDANYNYDNGHYCIGLGGFQQTTYWYGDGSLYYDSATALIEAANEAGVYWQDPNWQSDFCLEILDSDVVWDLNQNPGPDPKSSTSISADEWCARVTAGEGMPGWNYTYVMTSDAWYPVNHMAQVDNAKTLYEKYSGVDELFYDKNGNVNISGSVTGDVASYLYPFGGPAYDNSTDIGLQIARMGVLMSGETEVAYNGAPCTDKNNCTGIQKFDDSNLANTVSLQYYRYAQQALEGDFWASCDRGSTLAILLAGADDSMPRGPVSHIKNDYLDIHPEKWEKVGNAGKVKLQPGDFLVKDDHVVLYVGENVAGERWPGTTYNIVDASFFNHYLCASHAGESRLSQFTAYRCIAPEWSSDKWDKFMNYIGDKFPELPRQYSKTVAATAASAANKYNQNNIQAATTFSSNTDLAMDGVWAWPLKDNFYINSPFQHNRIWYESNGTKHEGPHLGCDITAPGGTPIYVPLDGEVIDVQLHSEWGNLCKISHGNGYATLYAHMNAPSVLSIGQKVKQGDLIGYVGSTGRSSGNHLHYELYIDNNGDGYFDSSKERVDILTMYPNLPLDIAENYYNRDDKYTRPGGAAWRSHY